MIIVRFVYSLCVAGLLLATAPFAAAQGTQKNGETYTPGQKINVDFKGFASEFLAIHCVDCHGETDPEGGLSLHDLGPVDEVNAGVWRAVWAQVTLKEMPPQDMDQPGVIEVVINGTTVFCEYDHVDIVVQAGQGELN